jgi:oligopeptide/dipeptide ABC transporter ATP-binding protein
MRILEIKNLVKHFPIGGSRAVVQAVNGISFFVNKGETLALVGESGSGKTTVGRCILGLVKPTEGNIYFQGEMIGKKKNVRSKDIRGKIQLVFQEPAESLDPRLKVKDTIREPLRALGLNTLEQNERVDEVRDRVGLSRRMLDQYPPELSIGQQQRVGIARAVVTKPKLVVLDEPTSALDPTARAEIIDLLRELQKGLNTSYVFISHDLNTVRYVSHRVAVMYLGMIVEEGKSDQIFSKPRHPYAVGLMSSVLLPNPTLKQPSIVNLVGEIPSPVDLPKGCYLAGRCPLAEERCREKMPEIQTVANGHTVYCYNYEKISASEDTIDYFKQFQREAEKVLSSRPNEFDLHNSCS